MRSERMASLGTKKKLAYINGLMFYSYISCTVDKIFLIKNKIPTLQRIMVRLSSKFSMMDLGEASYILRMKIYRDRS